MKLRSLGLAVLLVVGLLVVGLPFSANRSAQAAPEQIYLALGDSIAAGIATSLPRDRGYPWLLRNLIEQSDAANGQPATVTLDDLAVPGETVSSFLNGSQLQKAQSDIQADLTRGAVIRTVTVTLGGNDMLNLQNVPDDQKQSGLDAFKSDYPNALNAIKSALGDAKPDIVVTTYYDVTEGDPNQQGSDAWWLAQFNGVIRDAAKNIGAKVADLEPAFRGHIADWTWYPSDVHPNNDGHAEIAQLVWQALGYDKQAPKVTIDRPAMGTLERRTPTVFVTATDNIGVTGVELLVDGKHVEDLLYVPDQNAYIGVWDARNFSQPKATLTVRASDLAGNQTSVDVAVTLPGS